MSLLRASLLRAGLALLCGVELLACDGQPLDQGGFWRPWYDIADGAEGSREESAPDLAAKLDASRPAPGDLGALPEKDLGPPPRNCSLTVAVTTVTANGKYSPRNIGAIWVSDANARFVKTLSVWAERRVKHLKRWNAATAAAGFPADRTDAISSATKSSHGVRSGTWSCTDVNAKTVADGDYQVCFELTDYDGQGPYDCVPFTKGAAPLTITPADAPSFTNRKLEYAP